MTAVMETFDHIVIGAGSAGCAIASRLSEDASRRVLLLEAGGRDTSQKIHVPGGYFWMKGLAAYIAAVYPAGPDPIINTFVCLDDLLFITICLYSN